MVTTFIKHKIQQALVFSFFSLSGFTIVAPSFAASLDLSSWNKLGDVLAVPNQATLTNAFSDGSDDDSNYNVSGDDPTEINSLETFLGLNPGDLGVDATEGSAIQKAFNVSAGDVFSFDYSFLTYDTLFSDRAFVTINNLVKPLTGGFSFSYKFTTSGIYNIGIGVIDVDDISGSSILSVRNANYQSEPSESIPEPSIILGSMLTGSFGILLKIKNVKKSLI